MKDDHAAMAKHDPPHPPAMSPSPSPQSDPKGFKSKAGSKKSIDVATLEREPTKKPPPPPPEPPPSLAPAPSEQRAPSFLSRTISNLTPAALLAPSAAEPASSSPSGLSRFLTGRRGKTDIEKPDAVSSTQVVADVGQAVEATESEAGGRIRVPADGVEIVPPPSASKRVQVKDTHSSIASESSTKLAAPAANPETDDFDEASAVQNFGGVGHRASCLPPGEEFNRGSTASD